MEKSVLELEVQIETLLRRNAELEATLKKETARADNEHAGKQLAIAAARSGVLPNAINDAVYRASEAGQWKIRGGKLVRCNSDGLPELLGSGEDVTPQRAIDALRLDAGHLWPESSEPNQAAPQPATGAPQGRKPAAYTGPNPWAKGSSNLTMRVEIAERDPALADRLMKEAKEANQTVRHASSVGIPASRYRG